MISIQELGLSILSDAPSKLYILGGSEYGIKDKYIHKLTQLYAGRKYEYPTVMSVIDMMNTRHLIPLQPSLYVVRYDESFVSCVNDNIANKIRSTNMCGTLICIYSEDKHLGKIDKFLPEFTSQIDSVNPKFIEKYLKQDFPELDSRSIVLATKCASNYGHARNICKSLNSADKELINKVSDKSLKYLFGCSFESVESDIRLGIASRNFNYLIHMLDAYDDERESLYYTILQTMIDMEKLLTSRYFDTDIKDYKKFWKLQDVYHMFMNTYNELINSRSSSVSTDTYSSLVYLFALLTFKNIPSVEVMNDF